MLGPGWGTYKQFLSWKHQKKLNLDGPGGDNSIKKKKNYNYKKIYIDIYNFKKTATIKKKLRKSKIKLQK